MSKITKLYKRGAIFLTLLSVLCSIGPAIGYVIYGLISAQLVTQKASIMLCAFVAIIGSLLCLISRVFTFRSRIWVILLALISIVNSYLTMILVFAITQVSDEMIFAPAARYFRQKYSINKEIDKRGIT
jgi:hypothetical protein